MRFVAAIDARRGLATDQGIPWHLPTDQRYFVDQTRDGIILMGFGTYVEFDSPMHGRTNYVATRRAEDLLPGFVAVHDIPEFVTAHRVDRINNIGGAGLFDSTLRMADELVLTRIHADFACTKFFPEFEQAFRCVWRSDPVTENGSEFVFETWHPVASAD
jgi:dihydrofolate reductase